MWIFTENSRGCTNCRRDIKIRGWGVPWSGAAMLCYPGDRCTFKDIGQWQTLPIVETKSHMTAGLLFIPHRKRGSEECRAEIVTKGSGVKQPTMPSPRLYCLLSCRGLSMFASIPQTWFCLPVYRTARTLKTKLDTSKTHWYAVASLKTVGLTFKEFGLIENTAQPMQKKKKRERNSYITACFQFSARCNSNDVHSSNKMSNMLRKWSVLLNQFKPQHNHMFLWCFPACKNWYWYSCKSYRSPI